jgi:hypothetical protein
MFRTSHSVQTLAAPEEIWALVREPSRWKDWLIGLKLVQMQSPLASGVQGLLYLEDDSVYQIVVQKYDLGIIEIYALLRYGVKIRLMVDVSHAPSGSRLKIEGEMLGAMSIFHVFGWRKTLKMNIAPMTRRLGILSQEVRK